MIKLIELLLNKRNISKRSYCLEHDMIPQNFNRHCRNMSIKDFDTFCNNLGYTVIVKDNTDDTEILVNDLM